MTPVHLSLPAGRCLEPTNRNSKSFFALRSQPVRQDRITAVVITFPQFAQQHLRVPYACLEAPVQVGLKRLQLALCCRPRSVCRPVGRLRQISRDRSPVVTRQATDRPDASALPSELVDL